LGKSAWATWMKGPVGGFPLLTRVGVRVGFVLGVNPQSETF
jgi:hypothetical protein